MNGRRQDDPEPFSAQAHRGRVGTLLRRLFFRQEHHREVLLIDLIDGLAKCRDEAELAHDVGLGLLQALAPSHLHLFCRRATRFRLAYSGSEPLEPKQLMPANSALPGLTAGWHEPGSVRSLGQLPSEDRAWLRSWRTEWVVPLQYPPRSPNGVLGLMLLGPRPDGYSPVMLDLLQTLADRMARVYATLVEQEKIRLQVSQGAGTWLKECPECGRCYGTGTFYCEDDDAQLETTILVDRVINGRYALERNLGKGGMGLVYVAEDRRRSETVAVKLLTEGDRVAQGRFAREAQAGRVLDHPNIVQVVDSGELRGGAFIAMEYVQGRTLREMIDTESPVTPPRAARWFEQIFGAVGFAHARGVIHRDLKPDNIMMTQIDGREVPKILDFGLAKIRDSSGSSGQLKLTAAGMVIGTLSYMSPEQLAADPIDHRTDIFALGIMVCEALTGRPPFWSKNLGQMLRAVASTPFRLEVETLEQARVTDVLGRALAKVPANRYPDTESFRRELIPALEACTTFPRPEAPL
ncbi:MAG: serine/threonine-protein kinase [Acidobacteriota bacterium]